MNVLRKLLGSVIASPAKPIARTSQAGESRTANAAQSPGQASVVAEASALFDDGRFGDALATIELALASAPDDPELLFARASTLFAWSRSREARPAFLKAERAGLATAKLYLRSAWCCLWTGFPQEAERYMRKAVAADAR